MTMPLSEKLDYLNNRIDQHNHIIRKVWTDRIIQADFFNAQIVKCLAIITAIFIAIIVAVFTFVECIPFIAVAGLIAALHPIILIERIATSIFNPVI